MPAERFGGAKIALLCAGEILVYRRDDKAGIPFPGCWDLPGGGREGDEKPLACALRELREEFGLSLPDIEIVGSRRYPGAHPGSEDTWFFVAGLHPQHIADIRFGDEGQYWRMMPLADYLALSDAIPHLQHRLADYLAGLPTSACVPR